MVKSQKTGKQIVEAIVLVMAVVIISVVAALVVGTLLSETIFTNIEESGTISNETLSSVSNVTNSSFSILATSSSAVCGLTITTNATGGEIVNSDNYTFFTDCKLILFANSTYIGEDINATYTFAYTSTRNPTGVNISQIQEQFGLFVTGLLAFLAIIGTIIGVVWLVFYVKQLFDKKDGLQGITA